MPYRRIGDSQAIDLNTVIPPNSGLQLVRALSINDRGEIAGLGVPPGVSPSDIVALGHAFLLIPVDDDQDEDSAKADSRQDQQSEEAVQNDTTAPTTAPRINTITGETPSRVGQGNEDLIRYNRHGRFSRLPLPARKND